MPAEQVARLMQSKDASIEELRQQVDALTRRVDWFTRQHFGSRSERFISQPDPAQMCTWEKCFAQSRRLPNNARALPRTRGGCRAIR
jgi:hypothetical protein